MNVEYIVLGVILIIMGAVQTYLRHGPEGRKLRAEQDALQKRRAEQAAKAAASDPDIEPGTLESDTRARKRSNKAWTGWTAILGGVGIAVGIALIILGVLGR